MEIASLKAPRKRVITVPVADETGTLTGEASFTIWHKPITPNLIAYVDDLSADDNFDRLARQLAEVLTGWDLTQDGQPLSLSYETLRGFDWEFLALIRDELYTPSYPKKAT